MAGRDKVCAQKAASYQKPWRYETQRDIVVSYQWCPTNKKPSNRKDFHQRYPAGVKSAPEAQAV
eukprot:468744-Amphidinium_carterae.1